MPKPTFFNLPAAKREAIIALAVAEFAEHPYGVASLSRIVERAGIAKGSIYQYFAHKQELYLYTLEQAVARQLALLSAEAPPDPELGFFDLLRWQMQASMRVGLTEPLLTRLMYRAVSDDLPFRAEVERRLSRAGESHLRGLLERGVERGEIDSGLDLELAAFVLEQLVANLQGLIARRLGLSLEEVAGDPAAVAGAEVDALYDQVVQIIQHGLTPRARPASHEGATR
ncbi:MAG TPA: TetR/AcrR family transcriptional regulator [Chloroflexaceae bacterium]|nr:TetR/AcrR family transcriptional regulator [Chloroflexaceae bacterium]